MAETKKLGERLIDAGLITREALEKALTLQKSTPGMKLGDCLLSLRLVPEASLLRFLATEYQTRYVSADKLAKVKVPIDVLDRVPVRMAESVGLIPIMYEAERKIMSVVMAEPQNVAAVTELKIVGGLTDVFVFIGTRAAINAAIKKHYYGDPTAFDALENAPAPTPQQVAAVADYVESQRTDSKSVPSSAIRFETNPGTPAPTPRPGPSTTNPGASATSVRAAAELVKRSSLTSDNDYIETLNVLVGLLELRRKDAFRAHSAAVAKHSRTIAQRMGLPHREVNHITMAAYLHDLGKRPDRHLTLLSATQNAEWKLDAKRYGKAPIKLFETVHLPNEVNNILAQLYEAYDGSGQPQGVKGDAIPAGARIIAAVDSFEDLTKNAQSVFGEVYGKDKALEIIQEKAGTLFDPAVVDLMRQIHTGEILRAKLLSEGRQVLICHQDEGMRTDLRDALSRLGLIATVALSSDGLVESVRHGEVDLIITEVQSKPDDALAVAASLRQEPSLAGLPIVFLAEKDDAALRERIEGLGPAKLLAGDPDPEAVANLGRALLDERIRCGAPGRPVSGLLDEMGFDELLTTLASARLSGRITVRGAGKQGDVCLSKGRVVNAVCATVKGEAAVDQIAGFGEGGFTFDPNFLILDQDMDKDAEVLVKESSGRRKRAAPAA